MLNVEKVIRKMVPFLRYPECSTYFFEHDGEVYATYCNRAVFRLGEGLGCIPLPQEEWVKIETEKTKKHILTVTTEGYDKVECFYRQYFPQNMEKSKHNECEHLVLLAPTETGEKFGMVPWKMYRFFDDKDKFADVTQWYIKGRSDFVLAVRNGKIIAWIAPSILQLPPGCPQPIESVTGVPIWDDDQAG